MAAAVWQRSLLIVVLCVIAADYFALSTPTRGVFDVGRHRRSTLFRPLRRVVRNFVTERTASITLVFQRSDIIPRMRWFRQVEPNTLPNAEIPDMITIDGDSRYRVRTLSSHDVTAATLVIQPLDVTQYPVKFVTLFSINDKPFQYQLDTVIDQQTVHSQDDLDGIIWLRTPPANTSFSPQGTLSVSCAVKMESESSRFTDELNIYRSYAERPTSRSARAQLMSANCGKIHKYRDNYMEQAGKYTYEGHRQLVPGSPGHVVYQVSFKIVNGTQDDAGVYTCVGERAMDRTYVSSWVHLTQPLPPVMLFQPCNDLASTSRTGSGSASQPYQVFARSGRATCVRCRVFVQRPTLITLTKNGDRVRRSTSTMLLDWHLNVADGALSELTVNFIRPRATMDNGLYSCSASNGSGRQTTHFRLSVS